MRYKFLLLPVLSTIAALMLQAADAHAQTWRAIGKLPHSAYCAFFWDTAHGVVGGYKYIYTYRSGVWTLSTSQEPFDKINSIRQLKPGTLYAAQGASQILMSTDSGASWQLTGIPALNAEDVYMARDSSINWITAGSVARLDSMIYVRTHDDGGDPDYSTDGGLTWTTSPLSTPRVNGYSLCVDTCRKEFFATTEMGLIFFSIDSGRTWIQDGPGNQYEDILDGLDGVIYHWVSTGMECSVDAGASWRLIGGPPAYTEDHRMFAFGPRGKYLIALRDDAVWRCVNASDTVHPADPVIVRDTLLACGRPVFPVTIQPYGRSMRLRIHIADLGSGTVSPSDTMITMSAGQPVTFWLTVQNMIAGRTDDIQITTLDQENCATATWIDHLHAAIKNVFSFGNPTLSVGSCDSMSSDLPLSHCDSIRYDSIYIVPSNPNTLVLEPPPLGLRHTSVDTLHFRFRPNGTTGIAAYRVRVLGRVLATNVVIDTFITVSTNAIPATSPKITISSRVSVKACMPARVALAIKGGPCEGIRLDAITFDSLLLTPDSLQLPLSVSSARSDTVWFTVNTGSPFDSNTRIVCHFVTMINGMHIDTSFALRIIVSPSAPPVVAVNRSISNCTPSRFPVILRALPCDSVLFTSCKITIASGLIWDSSITFPHTVAADAEDTLWLIFPPQSLNVNKLVQLHLTGYYRQTHVAFDTAIQVIVQFISGGGSLVPAHPLSLIDSLSSCAEADTSITFFNYGCTAITVTSDLTTWQPGFSGVDPSFPLMLEPDSSFTLHVHYAPQSTGLRFQDIQYQFNAPGKTGLTSDPIRLQINTIPGLADLLVADTLIDLGSRSLCLPDTSLIIPLSSIGCDSLRISDITMDGAQEFSLQGIPDTSLAPTAKTFLHIHFGAQSQGAFRSVVHLHIAGMSGGNPHETAIALSAKITDGDVLATLSATAFDFGHTTVCADPDTTVVITNTGCDTLVLSRADLSTGAFSVADTTTWPIVLLPHESATMHVISHTDSTGHTPVNQATLTLASNATHGLAPISLSRQIDYPGNFGFAVATPVVNVPVDAPVPFYVLRNGNIPPSVDQLRYHLIYDDDALSFVNVTEADVSSIATTLLPDGRTDREFLMSPARDRDTIAHIEFRTYLAKSQHTSFTFADPSFVAAGETSPLCVANISPAMNAPEVTVRIGCGDNTIVNALRDQPLAIRHISPNPARNAIDVDVSGISEETDAPYATICDALGRTVMQDMHPSTHCHFDLCALPQGIYALRIEMRGQVTTQTFSVVR